MTDPKQSKPRRKPRIGTDPAGDPRLPPRLHPDPDLDPLRLAFYRGRDHGSWLDRLVARHDRGPHSHVEIAFANGLCASSSWRDGGVRFRRVDLDDGHWDTLPVPASPRDATIVRHWCARRVGGRYDVPGVLAFKLPLVRERLGWWFCSEFVAAALQRIGRLPGVRPASLSPNGLFRLWKGEVSAWGL